MITLVISAHTMTTERSDVVERKKPLDEKDNCPCKADVTWQAWDGTTKLENGKYYYLTADVIAPSEGFMLEGIGVSLRLDGHTISSPGRCFYLKGGAKLNICDHETRGKLIGSGILKQSAVFNDDNAAVSKKRHLFRLINNLCLINIFPFIY